MKPQIGLVVPRLQEIGGGVSSVARFIKDTVLRSGLYELKVISLATSARDECNVSLSQPGTWRRGATVSRGTWEGLPLVHVGAVIGEVEFRRCMPRGVLAEVVTDCDILQVVCGSPAYANALSGFGKPVSVQCATRAKIERRLRDAKPSTGLGWWRKAMTEITDRLDDRVLRSADAIQVENQWMYDYARALNSGRDVDLRYAPPGVNAGAFRPNPARNVGNDPYLLCVGRLDDTRKNIGLLLDAYLQLPPKVRSELRVVLAGVEPPATFWARAEKTGVRERIQFVARPSAQQLVMLYQNASMFIMTSDEEGLGIALLEAMACGIPVVSTRSGGPDGIISDGNDGFLVPLEDAALIYRRISQLHLDPHLNRSMGDRARKTIEQRFTTEIAGAAFLDVWDRLLHKSVRITQCAV